MGVVGSVAAILIGIGWTVMATNFTSHSPFPGVGLFFPMFGVLFVIMAIAGLVYNLRNAASQNRNSIVDITGPDEEPDPLNLRFGSQTRPDAGGESTETRLQKLEGLRQKGLIDDAEYAEQRRRILGEI